MKNILQYALCTIYYGYTMYYALCTIYYGYTMHYTLRLHYALYTTVTLCTIHYALFIKKLIYKFMLYIWINVHHIYSGVAQGTHACCALERVGLIIRRSACGIVDRNLLSANLLQPEFVMLIKPDLRCDLDTYADFNMKSMSRPIRCERPSYLKSKLSNLTQQFSSRTL